MKKVLLTFILFFMVNLGLVNADNENKNITEKSANVEKRIEMIRDQINYNRIMTQIHRWYLFYENDKVNLDEQIDILTDDITVKSALGERHGKDEYRTTVMQLPKTWKNAHHITKANINGMNLLVEIVYQNIGMLPKEELRTVNINYNAKLIDNGDVLPKFKSITLTPQENEKVKAGYAKFKDAYPENRLKSLVHYYLALIEFKYAPKEDFKHIFDQKINFKFSEKEIKSHDEFFEWLDGTRKRIFISTHILENFKYKALGEGLYKIEMEFQWYGFTEENKNQELEGRTSHKWIVYDDPAEKFPKIQSIEVKFIKPFQERK